MSRLLCLLFIPMIVSAEERWAELKSGPFHVLSLAGDKAAREQMNQLEQFRHALGTVLGKPDLKLVWPARVMIFKNSKQAPATANFALARDGYYATTVETSGLSAVEMRALAKLLIEQNTQRLPAAIERGLIDLFSTLEISGTRITLGTPVPVSERSRDWARVHLLNVDPAYAGRSRVMISNLEQGSELDVACRNAFQKAAAEIEKQVDAYTAAATFGTTTVSGKPISAARDYHPQAADSGEGTIAIADLLLAAGSKSAEASFLALHGAEAAEGLALIFLRAGKKNEARTLFHSAFESGSKSARAYYEAAVIETDPAAARKELNKAVELNPRWAQPVAQLAFAETDLDRKAELLKKATALDPRNVEYWQALAKNETEATRFIDAQKAWGGAERAAATPEEREHIRQIRLGLQAERAEHEAAERRRKAEEAARDLERVKNDSMTAIHQAEAAANKKLNPDGTAPPTAVEWWNGAEAGAKVEGLLQKFDCIGRQARLVVLGADGKSVQVLVRDPSQLVIGGGGQTTLGCGVQKPARKVVVQYNPKPDKKTGTAGDAVSIEFR